MVFNRTSFSNGSFASLLLLILILVSASHAQPKTDSVTIMEPYSKNAQTWIEKTARAQNCLNFSLLHFEPVNQMIYPFGAKWTEKHQRSFIDSIDCIETYMQENAISVLSSFHTPQAIRTIEYLYSKHAKDYPFPYAIAVIHALDSAKDSAFIPTMRRMLHDSIPNIRGEAAIALSDLGDTASMRELKALIVDKQPYQMTTPHFDHTKGLVYITHSNSETDTVSRSVDRAMRRIGLK